METSLWEFLFFIRVFFHGHWELTGEQGKGGDHLLFHFTTSTCSRTSRHLLATSHVRWLSHIFNRNACIHRTASLWDLPPYHYLIDWWCDIYFCFLVRWIDFSFCYSHLTWETSGHKLVSNTILVLQANRLIKCASHLVVFYRSYRGYSGRRPFCAPFRVGLRNSFFPLTR